MAERTQEQKIADKKAELAEDAKKGKKADASLEPKKSPDKK